MSNRAADLSQVAGMCVDDLDYARQVLEGEDYPEVRADLAAEVEVTGYLMPELKLGREGAPLPKDFEALRGQWSLLDFAQTRGIIIIGG